jgi:hypothetical protein
LYVFVFPSRAWWAWFSVVVVVAKYAGRGGVGVAGDIVGGATLGVALGIAAASFLFLLFSSAFVSLLCLQPLEGARGGRVVVVAAIVTFPEPLPPALPPSALDFFFVPNRFLDKTTNWLVDSDDIELAGWVIRY